MPPPSLTLFRGFPSSPSYVWSPFATKLEARLRFAYRTDQGAPPKAPRAKIPYIAISERTGDDAAPEEKTVADTALISEMLVADGLAEDLNGRMTAAEKAQDLAVRALLEDKLYFYQNYERWEQNYYTMRSKIFAALPYPLQVLVGQLSYRKMSATLYGQGTGRFTAEEISRFKKEIWENVNALLTASSRKRKRGAGGPDDDGMFFVLGGDGPTEADTTLFGFVASGLVCAAASKTCMLNVFGETYRAPETQQILRSLPIIVDYADKIHKHYFPDYEHWEQ